MGTPKGSTWSIERRSAHAARLGSPASAILRRVEYDTAGGCWLWAGTLLHGTGYGQIQRNGRGLLAHRLSYEAFNGPIPAGLHVCHRCDIRACVNPGHLFVGTNADNIHDMFRKGRDAPPRGSDHGKAKLKEGDIAPILARLLTGETCAAIATDYGVTDCAINAIRRGKSWTHITGLKNARKFAWGAREGVLFSDPKDKAA